MTAPSQANWMDETCTQGLVSVIVPAYNRAAILPQTLDSVGAQSYRPIELLIIDDGSSDDTRTVVETWSNPYRSDTALAVRYISQPNRGACAARNHGLCASRGQFIQFLDSDDRLRPTKLEKQVSALLAEPDLDYVYAQTVQIGSDGSERARTGNPMDSSVPARNIPLHLWHTTAPLYRRRVCVQAGPWDEALRMSQDWDYAARIKAVSLKARFLPEVLSEYVMHGGGQIVMKGTLREIASRNRAIHNVMGLLSKCGVHDRAAWDICSRSLVAAGIHAGVHGDHAQMRKDFTEASRIGYARTRGMARVLRTASYIAPPVAFKWLLNRVR